MLGCYTITVITKRIVDAILKKLISETKERIKIRKKVVIVRELKLNRFIAPPLLLFSPKLTVGTRRRSYAKRAANNNERRPLAKEVNEEDSNS